MKNFKFSFASIAKLSNKEFNIQKIENVSSDETLHLSAFIDQLLIQPIESISAKKNVCFFNYKKCFFPLRICQILLTFKDN